MSAYAEQLKRLRAFRPYEIGSSPCNGEATRFSVCDGNGHVLFFSTHEAAAETCARMNADARQICASTREFSEAMS